MSLSPALAHLSSYDLESLRLGALAPARADAARRHLQTCADCRAREQTLQGHREVFEREVLPRTLPALRALADGHSRRSRAGAWRRWLAAGFPVAAVATLALVTARRPPPPSPGPTAAAEPTTIAPPPATLAPTPTSTMPAAGIKGTGGGASFLAVARQGARVFPLPSAARLRPGDRIRFVVDPGPHRFLLVVSVDGAGGASVYHPFDGRESAPVIPHRRLEVPGSIVLDRAPGPERLFALYSDRPLTAGEVLPALQKIGAAGATVIRQQRELPPLPGVMAQASTLLEKAP
jgi:hypothetical protein